MTTCGLTNLPIVENDMVTVLVLARRNPTYHPFHLYSTDTTELMTPFLLPIYGEYDGKGSIKEIQIDPLSEAYLRSLSVIPKGKCLCKQTAPIEEVLWECVQPHASIKQDFIPLAPLSMMFYHKEAFERVVSAIGNRIPVFQNQSYRTLLKHRIASKTTQAITDLNTKGNIRFHGDSFFQPDDVTTFCIPYLTLYQRHTKTLSQEQQVIEQTQFEEGVNNLLCFLKGLELLRKGFGCITGIKTDQYELELHKNLAEFTLQFYEKTKSTVQAKTDTWAEETIYWYPNKR